MAAVRIYGLANDLFRSNSEEHFFIRLVTEFFQNLFTAVPRWLYVGIALCCFMTQGGEARGQTVATPVLTPTSGTSYMQFNVTVTDTTSGATLYYTTNGSTPTTSSSTVTSGGTETISQSETLEVLGIKSGYTNSTEFKAQEDALMENAFLASPLREPHGPAEAGLAEAAMSQF